MIFSISPAHRPALEQYIANQAEHHRKVTFRKQTLVIDARKLGKATTFL